MSQTHWMVCKILHGIAAQHDCFFDPWYVMAYIHLNILFQPRGILPKLFITRFVFAVLYHLILSLTGSSWPHTVFSHSL